MDATDEDELLACDDCVPRETRCEWWPIDKEDIEENPEGVNGS